MEVLRSPRKIIQIMRKIHNAKKKQNNAYRISLSLVQKEQKLNCRGVGARADTATSVETWGNWISKSRMNGANSLLVVLLSY